VASSRGDQEDGLARELIDSGSELAGAATGGALGLIGGPVGVAAGAASGVVVTRALKHVGAEIQKRLLAPRQRIRAGAAFAVAADEINERLHAGEDARDDGFFQESGQRSSAEELLEGVLLHAATEYEERKVPYLGRLYASLAFRADVTPAQAHFLLRLADQLTYRQYVMLAIFGSTHAERVELAWQVSPRFPLVPRPAGEALRELDDLGTKGLLGFQQDRGREATPPAGTWGTGSFSEASHIKITPTNTGSLLIDLCGLVAIPAEEKAEVFRAVISRPPVEPNFKLEVTNAAEHPFAAGPETPEE
jgi:hypothetical protein